MGIFDQEYGIQLSLCIFLFGKYSNPNLLLMNSETSKVFSERLHDALCANLPVSSKLLLAVSGGADSMSMLHACVCVCEGLELNLEVAHVDHRLRPESQAEADFVSEQAQKYDLPFHLKVADSCPSGENIENWARKLRYGFFKATLEERQLDYIVTAHNANDVAETLLMRLVSNKELNGIEKQDSRRRLIRPMIGLSRKDIEAYAVENGLAYVHDVSNDDQTYLRNKIRHTLFPFMVENFHQDIVSIVAERAEALAEDYLAIDEILSPILNEVGKNDFGSKTWLRGLRNCLGLLPEGLRWRLVEKLFYNHLGFNLGRTHSKQLLRVVLGERVAVQLPTGVEVRASGGGLKLGSAAQD